MTNLMHNQSFINVFKANPRQLHQPLAIPQAPSLHSWGAEPLIQGYAQPVLGLPISEHPASGRQIMYQTEVFLEQFEDPWRNYTLRIY